VDFDSGPINVIFFPEETRKTVNIPVMCDRLIEGIEKFDITLNIASVSANVVVELGHNRSIVEIEDSTGYNCAIVLINITIIIIILYVYS